MMDQLTNNASRRRTAIRMGTGVTLGIVLGTATGNIALGLVIGILAGGLGAIWKKSENNHMKSLKRKFLFPTMVLLIAMCAGIFLFASQYGSLSINLPVEHKSAFVADTRTYPSHLHADGNKIVNVGGEVVTLRGLMPPDPAVVRREGRFNRVFFDQMANTGANVIRIPVHPEQWEHDPDYLWRYLDPVVTWNGENGVYTIIDLHFIGSIETDSGSQMPDIRTPSKDFALEFWREVATYFKDTPNVIFEIFNEPANISAADWRKNAQLLVDTIRATGAEQLIIVGGIEYSRDLSWVLETPIEGKNLAYASHIYPAHNKYSWDQWFGNVAEQYPVILTEWGWMEADPSGEQTYLVGSQKSYGEPFMEYLEQREISWVACWYDDEWKPALFETGFERPTHPGKFVLQALSMFSHSGDKP